MVLGQERPPTKSRLEHVVFKTYFAFLLFNILLLSTLTSQLGDIAIAISHNPSGAVTEVARTLGKTLPNFGAFFINYVMNMTFISGAFGLTRIVFFIMHTVQLRWAKTPREIEEIKMEGVSFFEYDYQVR